MNNQKINSSAPDIKVVNLSQLFAGIEGTFKIPDYQREYSWTEQNIKDLIQDFVDFQKELSAGENTHYLLGQAIFSEIERTSSKYSLSVVDGQQRLTSLYLLGIVLYRWINYFSNAQDSAVASRLRQVMYHTDLATGTESPRIGVSYGGDEFISILLQDHELPEVTINSTQKNLKANYTLLYELVQQNFGDNRTSLLDFIDIYLHKVWLIVVTLENDSMALSIFDKINSRGLPLSNASLLKNLVFREAKEEEYNEITDEWNAATEATFKVRPVRASSMQFLLKSVLGQRLGVGVSNNQIAKHWAKLFKEKKEDMVVFAKNVKHDAIFLSKLGSPSVTKENKLLLAARYFQTVQHLPVALASRKFSVGEHYDSFIKFLDTRVLLSILARERNQDFDRIVWPWAQKLSLLDSSSSEYDILAAGKESLEQLDDLLLPNAKSQVEALDYRKPRDLRMIRFLFAICNRIVEDDAGRLNREEVDLLSLINPRKYHIDHIFPKSLVESADFDLTHGKEWVHKIGNLTFLHHKDNPAAGAANPGEKSVDYASSELLLTVSFAKTNDIVKNNREKEVVSRLHNQGFQQVSSTWGYDEVILQTEAYWKLISRYIREGLQLEKLN